MSLAYAIGTLAVKKERIRFDAIHARR